MIRRRAPSVLAPAMFADQRHEHDGAQILFVVFSLAPARYLEQRLTSLLAAHRNDQVATDRQLRFQGRRRLRTAGRDKDCIERRGLRPAFRPITDTQLNVVVTELAKAAPRRFGKRTMTLD